MSRHNLFSRTPKVKGQSQDEFPISGLDKGPGGYGGDRSSTGAPTPSTGQAIPSGPPVSKGTQLLLRVAKVEDAALVSQYMLGNLCAVSSEDFAPPAIGQHLYLLLNGKNVVTARPASTFPRGCISLNDHQRAWCQISLMDKITCDLFDTLSLGPQSYLEALDLEAGFASIRKTTDVPFDQDHLAETFTAQFHNQIFAPGQKLIMDYKNVYLSFTVKTIRLTGLNQGSASPGAAVGTPTSRGILTSQTLIAFYKEVKSTIRFKGSKSRPATNSPESDPLFVKEFGTAIPSKILHFSPHIGRILKDGRLFADLVRNSPAASCLFSVLLHGPPQSGQTALAVQMAWESEFPNVNFLTADNMVGFTEVKKAEYILKIFTEAYRSPRSIIVVDSIERIVEWVPIEPRFSNPILQVLLILLAKKPPTNSLLIIGTTSQRMTLKDLGLQQIFDRELAVPSIQTHEELAFVLREVQAFRTESDLAESLNKLRAMEGGKDHVGIGIKKVLRVVEEAKQDVGNVGGRFVEVMRMSAQ